MNSKDIKKYQEAVGLIQRLTDRMTETDSYGEHWGRYVDRVIQDFREFLNDQEEAR